jgi:N-acetylmuramoyl-L-alanine amidase
MAPRHLVVAAVTLAATAATSALATGAALAPPSAAHCGLEPPAVALAAPPVPRRAWETGARAAAGAPHVRRAGRAATGALAGKTVYVSAGHGWTYAAGAWRTQRGTTNAIVEDLVSAEAIDQMLVDELERMGARVVTVREHDMNPERVVVDDAAATLEGAVQELGAGPPGWGALPEPIADQSNPFAAGGTRQLAATTGEARGRAVFAPAIPASAYYDVYVSYAAGADRAPDAHVIVRHAGGATDFRVDQRRHGGTWVRLGRFWFDAGAPAERASVAVADDSAAPGAVISLDAVRFGGGRGTIDRGGGAWDRPMFEHNARYNAQLFGAPPAVYDYTDTDGNDDVGTRSRFAAWDHEEGEDAIYVAWHTNAPNPGRGTESYTYGPSAPPGPIGEFSGVPGSLELQAAVHDELVGDIRAGWDPAWKDRGKFTAYFGEVNPTHNPEMPATLVEIGFHDTPADADALRDPRFRRIATRAMAQGVARYFAARDGAALTLPPEPPSAVRVQNDGAGGLVVSWRPPVPEPGGGDAPTGYRVYVSRDGRSFDEGTDAGGGITTLTLGDVGLGEIRWVRVAALNAGGESRPSELVGARVGAAPVLIVGGFDRLDAGQLVKEEPSPLLGIIDRMYLDRMNDGAHALRHGRAVAAASVSFDGATDEAVAQGDVELARYRVVDWFAGEDSAGDDPLGAGARAQLAAYLAGGGRLLLSGAELAWALDFMGTSEEQAFFRETLNASYAADDADTFAVTPVEGPYQSVPTFSFDDGAAGGYLVDYPDVLAPGPGAALALEYAGGAGGGAAIVWGAGAPGERGVLLGFPFETVAGDAARAQIMAATLAFFEVEPETLPPDAGPGGGGDGVDGGCGCRAAGRAPRGDGGAGGAAGTLVACLALICALGLGKLRSR